MFKAYVLKIRGVLVRKTAVLNMTSVTWHNQRSVPRNWLLLDQQGLPGNCVSFHSSDSVYSVNLIYERAVNIWRADTQRLHSRVMYAAEFTSRILFLKIQADRSLDAPTTVSKREKSRLANSVDIAALFGVRKAVCSACSEASAGRVAIWRDRSWRTWKHDGYYSLSLDTNHDDYAVDLS
eukprot:IDg1691t1